MNTKIVFDNTLGIFSQKKDVVLVLSPGHQKMDRNHFLSILFESKYYCYQAKKKNFDSLCLAI
jgi:hypothetical protein